MVSFVARPSLQACGYPGPLLLCQRGTPFLSQQRHHRLQRSLSSAVSFETLLVSKWIYGGGFLSAADGPCFLNGG